MRIVVDLLPRREERSVDLPEGATGMDLLTALDLAPDAHLIVRGDVPIPHDEPLAEGDVISIIGVVSGGLV